MMVPPMLEAALGCSSNNRYILIYKCSEGDAAWTDGQKSMYVYWPTWLLYSNSPAVKRFLRHHSLQLLDENMVHGLVLDRINRRFSIDDLGCINARLRTSVDRLYDQPIEHCTHLDLAAEMTQHIASFLYK